MSPPTITDFGFVWTVHVPGQPVDAVASQEVVVLFQKHLWSQEPFRICQGRVDGFNWLDRGFQQAGENIVGWYRVNWEVHA